MVGRQLPLFAFFLPFLRDRRLCGLRAMLKVWPVLLVAGGSFAGHAVRRLELHHYSLTDVLSSLVSLILTILFLKVWKPAPDERFALAIDRNAAKRKEAPSISAASRAGIRGSSCRWS
ncbi:MAG: L-lactate permease [Pararobbsia sp.]